MRKIRVIAGREYAAAVRSKAFLVTMLLMPMFIATSAGLQYLFKKLEERKEKNIAIVDRTANQRIAQNLEKELKLLDVAALLDAEKAKMLGPKIKVEILAPSEPLPASVAQQRFEISQRIEKGEVDALIEIGTRVFDVPELLRDASKVEDEAAVRVQVKNPMNLQYIRRVEVAINHAVTQERLQGKGITIEGLAPLLREVVVKRKSLTRQDPQTGKFVDATDQTQFVNLFLPPVLIMLMFVVIMIGATPAMHGVVEEKSLRIAEVLLGSATPFQLMAGKLLGIIGVALTMAAVYLAGGYYLAWQFGVAEMLPLSLLIWFLVMLILALMSFGSLFIAIGAAASDIKDTQTLLMPVMLIACMPLFALGPIMQDPNGPIARVSSFFPFATPMLMVARHAVPPGVPTGELLAGIALVLATTWLCVWAAGRIFRVGILMQGKGPRFHELIKWAIKG